MIAVRACRTLHLRGLRCFSQTAPTWSGHNRWSKIKHDKAREDAAVTKQRNHLAAELTKASRENGPDPNHNPRLAASITAAKKAGFPKVTMENAIARGQGRSSTGAILESVTVEAMLPPSVAAIIECETDSRLRTLADVRLFVKEAGGTVTPTFHLFEKRGRVVLENSRGLSEEDIFDQAIEAGATDIRLDEEGDIEIFTEPAQTMAAAQALSGALDIKVKSSDIMWDPKKETMVRAEDTQAEDAENLKGFLNRVHDDPSVQEVYLNVT